MALFPTPQESCFWFDFESLTDGNLWADRGPHGLHAAPQAGFAAPNYGLAKTSRGKGYATFTGGANCYATLPLRFYDVAPTQDFTFVMVSAYTTLATSIAFQAYGLVGGSHYGIILYLDSNFAAGGGRVVFHPMVGTAVVQTVQVAITQQRTQTWVASNANPPSAWESRVGTAAVRAAGAYAPIVYDPTFVPRIGADNAGGARLYANIYFLALFPFPFTDAEAKAMSDWLRNQV